MANFTKEEFERAFRNQKKEPKYNHNLYMVKWQKDDKKSWEARVIRFPDSEIDDQYQSCKHLFLYTDSDVPKFKNA